MNVPPAMPVRSAVTLPLLFFVFQALVAETALCGKIRSISFLTAQVNSALLGPAAAAMV